MAERNYPDPILVETLKWEGGLVDDSRDPGGRTNQGVTQATYDAWRKTVGYPGRRVDAMSRDERDAIYRSEFWARIGGDTLPDGVDLAVFDYAVNAGPTRACRSLRAVAGLSDPVAVVRALCAARLSFLHGLRKAAFEKGWTRRVAAIEALGVKMALNARIGVPPIAPPSESVSLQLKVQARAAARTAKTRGMAAQAAVATGAAGTFSQATPAPVPHIPLALVMLVTLLVAGLAAALFWRKTLHGARADAYSTLAHTTTGA